MSSNIKLADSLRSHDVFFQMFVEMIPKEIYNGNDESEDLVNPRYFKHRKEPLTLHEKKLLSRKRKSEKYSLKLDDVRIEYVLYILSCILFTTKN